MSHKPKPHDDSQWHLDKRVPLSLILAILLQTAGMVWFAATITERVNVLEQKTLASAPQSDRLTRVEVKLEVVQDGVNEIKRLIQTRR